MAIASDGRSEQRLIRLLLRRLAITTASAGTTQMDFDDAFPF
jgi:hypothetical protein